MKSRTFKIKYECGVSKWSHVTHYLQINKSDREDLSTVTHDPQILLVRQLILHPSMMFMINIEHWMSFSQWMEGWESVCETCGTHLLWSNVHETEYTNDRKVSYQEGVSLFLSFSWRRIITEGGLMKREYFMLCPLISSHLFYFIYLEVIVFIRSSIFKSPV